MKVAEQSESLETQACVVSNPSVVSMAPTLLLLSLLQKHIKQDSGRTTASPPN
jgi:hypothetical protein